ncbi:hypothetical protein PHYBLDRAFT_169671 [Phycomyces blakesleeanus NRRL 1555(-)]|uniref:Uncharacterized protein n=1 Tax=Phycomyces blakesleeanus (strain ATCC 8743b / DSM 1359 / FGSC 10004 / NBRC 33097 / NRRL 1555) TaxID=763407 RepID=A0A162U5R4_PHYB8|nr:hypothetical protein PHYBLDRAFT_169671 [Phycomyces blakesleeanus NRRL 1555(-)]OAD72543.1 hypothetical protein PHYBLDRAFT_169671 [Phycomyces blakesleeanus NRRL 1555(-)]|eukprot:XP_018290583.1 hypothetical protein PHYBLDRAFT_169671 [Phycomyces blakesleeanus NRRL 1555(-)]
MYMYMILQSQPQLQLQRYQSKKIGMLAVCVTLRSLTEMWEAKRQAHNTHREGEIEEKECLVLEESLAWVLDLGEVAPTDSLLIKYQKVYQATDKRFCGILLSYPMNQTSRKQVYQDTTCYEQMER